MPLPLLGEGGKRYKLKDLKEEDRGFSWPKGKTNDWNESGTAVHLMLTAVLCPPHLFPRVQKLLM